MIEIENKKNKYIFSTFIFLSTFDAIVIPFLRLSIGDLFSLFLIIWLGISKKGITLTIKFIILFIPIIICANSLIILLDQNSSLDNFIEKLTPSNMGFIRPFFFTIIAINIYYSLKLNNIKNIFILEVMQIAGVFLSIIVLLQFAGIFPYMYHNNPSFGEVGKISTFTDGWRPTGLTNEASFVGNFLFLFLLCAIKLKKDLFLLGVERYRQSLIIFFIFFGCLLSTSRIASILSILALIFSIKSKILVVFSGIFLLVILLLMMPDRYLNLLEFSGDASTIERYGSYIAYFYAIIDPANIFGTGYLLSGQLVASYADNLFLEVLGDRQLVSFALLLQIILEFGPILSTAILTYFIIKYRNYFNDILLIGVLSISFFTGIQNFLFIYVFIAILIYVRNSYHS